MRPLPALALALLLLLPAAAAQTTSGSATTTTTASSGGSGGGCACTTTSTATATGTSSWPVTTMGPGPWFLISAGATDVVTVPQGATRDVPVTVAARGKALTNAHLVVDDGGGVGVLVDGLVRTVPAGGEQAFYLRVTVPAGAEHQAYLVRVHAEGRNGATPVETLQVVAFTAGSGGAAIPVPGLAPSLLLLAVVGLALLRRRLPNA